MRPYFTPDGWAGGELRQLEGLGRLVIGFNGFSLSSISFKTFISFHGRTLCHCDVLHANMDICYLVKSFAGGTCGFSYREDQVVPSRDC